MKLRSDRPRTQVVQDQRLLGEMLTPAMVKRGIAAEAAFVICGGVSEDEVFTSDVLDVAAFIVGDDVVDAAIVCGVRDDLSGEPGSLEVPAVAPPDVVDVELP